MSRRRAPRGPRRRTACMQLMGAGSSAQGGRRLPRMTPESARCPRHAFVPDVEHLIVIAAVSVISEPEVATCACRCCAALYPTWTPRPWHAHAQPTASPGRRVQAPT